MRALEILRPGLLPGFHIRGGPVGVRRRESAGVEFGAVVYERTGRRGLRGSRFDAPAVDEERSECDEGDDNASAYRTADDGAERLRFRA